MDSVFISELDELNVSHDLHVNNSKIIINSLIKHHMINQRLDLLSFCPDPLDSININVLKQLVNLLVAVDFVNQCSQEINQRLIVILDAEEQTIKQGHRILFNITRMFTYAVNDLEIKSLLFLRHLSA